MPSDDPRSQFLTNYRNGRALNVSVNALGWNCDGIYRQWARLGYDKYLAIAAVHWHQSSGASVVNASPSVIDRSLRRHLDNTQEPPDDY